MLNTTHMHVYQGQFYHAGSNIYNMSNHNVTVFDMLKTHTNFDAAYNSLDRQLEYAHICQENTREKVLHMIRNWANSRNGHPVCWLHGPAGSGKSTIAHTIAHHYERENKLAFSFFFSRRNPARNDITKFFPTFAYQLARFLPSIQQPLRDVLANSNIADLRLEDQFKKLIIEPISNVALTSPMIVVVDGLDEYAGKVPLDLLIQILVNALPGHLPFRLLFTSRPEAHIKEAFRTLSIHNKTHCIALQDLPVRLDVYTRLHSRLSEIRMRRNLPESWPAEEDIWKLVDQSEGLFLYVDTLIRFIDDEYGAPQHRLLGVMNSHRGLDPLFDQVLCNAKRYPHFERVIGAVLFLRNRLDIDEMEPLLGLGSVDIRLALRGCLSILRVPDVDDDYIRPYHASLREYLVDLDRSKDHFLCHSRHNAAIMRDCINLILGRLWNNAKGCAGLRYACRNWCHHFGLVLSCAGGVDHVNSHFTSMLELLFKNLHSRWLKVWMINLRSHKHLEEMRDDFEFAWKCLCEQESAPKQLVQGLQQVIEAIEKVYNFLLVASSTLIFVIPPQVCMWTSQIL